MTAICRKVNKVVQVGGDTFVLGAVRRPPQALVINNAVWHMSRWLCCMLITCDCAKMFLFFLEL